MSSGQDVNQSGKSGGDVTGNAAAGAVGVGGAGLGAGAGAAAGGMAYAEGTGMGDGGMGGGDALAGQMGGDVSDNTSMGDINISS